MADFERKSGIRTEAAGLAGSRFVAGHRPCDRDSVWAAFGSALKDMENGQVLAGSGALVFEGELLEVRSGTGFSAN